MTTRAPTITRTHDADWIEEAHPSGQTWRHVPLDGERLGARLECLHPGEASSIHHWHTAEEEHVLVLEGTATLLLGPEDARETATLGPGDHVCFRAGVDLAHHLENRGDGPLRYLVFGERNPHDVVVYPDHQVMLTKGWDAQTFTYRPFDRSAADGGDDGEG